VVNTKEGVNKRTRTGLRSPEVLKYIGSEASLNMSWTVIAEGIRDKFDFFPSPQAVERAYDVYATRRAELVATNPELNKAIKKEVLNSTNQLKSINEILWKLIGELKESGESKDIKLVISMAREIREQIKISNEMSRSFIEKLDPSKINKIEYTKVVINSLKELESSGIITINKEAARALEMKEFLD